MNLNIYSHFFKLNIISKRLIIICVLLFSTAVFAQNNETNNWYFGEFSDINFSSQQQPQTLQNSSMLAPAGCSSISDNDGNLLFYTNSETVWDKNNNIMVGGSNIFGNKNADQNSIIIPIPNLENQYYIFTVGTDGFYYSKIDTSLNNGFGEVILSNVALLSSTEIGKLTAVHHLDGRSIWVMTTKKNDNNQYTSFYAYKINIDGTIDEPIISNNFSFVGKTEGIMKFSPNGKRLAISNFIEDNVVNHLFIFNFNNETGVLSNKVNIFTAFAFFAIVSAYGIEFSNDSEILYVTARHQNASVPGNPITTVKRNLLYQYNLRNFVATEPPIVLSEEIGLTVPASLQLAKNGKIYRALMEDEDIGLSTIGVINSPNTLGTSASYDNSGADLSGNKSGFGLPNFIQSFFRTRIIDKLICEGIPIDYEIDTYANITSANWDFGDGNTSNEISPNYTYTNSGNFTITVEITVNNRQITTSKKVSVYERPNLAGNQELLQCDTDNDGISVFNLNNIREKITNPDVDEELTFYESIEDAQLDINAISNSESYTNIIANQDIFVRSTNSNSCYTITSFKLKAPFVDLITIPNFYTCEDSDNTSGNSEGTFWMNQIIPEIRTLQGFSSSISVEFFPTLLDAQIIQNEIRATLTTTSTIIWMRAFDNSNTCMGIAPINLIVNSNPIIQIEDEYPFCPDTPISLFGHGTNSRFEWKNSNNEIISTLQQFTPTSTGTYTHIAYKFQNGIECSASKSFILNQINPPIFETISTDLDYNNNSIYIDMLGNDEYEFSLDNINFYGNSNEYVFHNLPSGKQTIYVRDINQCEETISKILYLIGYPKFITPNNDGINDFWQIKGVDNIYIKSARIFDRYGKHIITLNEQNGFRWNGQINEINLRTDAYWFKIEFKDGTIKTGHFTLKH